MTSKTVPPGGNSEKSISRFWLEGLQGDEEPGLSPVSTSQTIFLITPQALISVSLNLFMYRVLICISHPHSQPFLILRAKAAAESFARAQGSCACYHCLCWTSFVKKYNISVGGSADTCQSQPVAVHPPHYIMISETFLRPQPWITALGPALLELIRNSVCSQELVLFHELVF